MSCPICGAESRIGIWLPKKKWPIFDMIWRARDDGIPAERLMEAFGITRINLKQHIYGINSYLEETDFVIRGEPGLHDSRYRVVKR